MSDWQPIKTAPRDGTKILVSDGDGIEVMFWSRRGWDDGDFHSGQTWPTHWMPLPSPPETDNG